MNHFLIVVTFNPTIDEFIFRINNLINEGVIIIIIDNNSDIDFSISGVIMIKLNDNLGIAAAQNIGIKKALESGAESITFLDQDTSIDAASIKILANSVKYHLSPIAVPLCKSRSTGRYYDIVWWDFRKHILRRDYTYDSHGERWTNIAISSGLTVNCKILTADTFMDHNLFIDYVDTEWCLRMFRLGYKIRILSNIHLLHEIGDRTLNFKFFRLPIHSPLRRYYRVRNTFLLIRYPHIPILFSIRNIIIVSIQQLLLCLLIRKDSISYINYYLLAIKDATLLLFKR